MSDEWGYNIEEYQLITGEISNRKRLIVEGKTDKRFFKVLLDEFLRTSNNYSKIDIEDIDIDDIETFLTNNNDLKSYISGAVRNRKKIEYVHENVKNSPRYDNLIFFLDREFDNFIISYTQEIKDEINEHKVDGALILSRGHSIENYLFDYYGANQVLWVEEGIVGDDTDGHIDDTIRFVNEDTVLTVVESNTQDENYTILQENLAQLKKMRLLNGKQLNIVELPMPDAVIYEDQRLPASYANFYISNKYVIVPTFRSEMDDKALLIISEAYKNREVVGIDSTDIIWGLGSFHCLSQQEPLV